jgi:hypothetical protein
MEWTPTIKAQTEQQALNIAAVQGYFLWFHLFIYLNYFSWESV